MPQRSTLTLLLASCAFFFLFACSKPESEQGVKSESAPETAAAGEPVSGVDYHSFANTDAYRV